MNLSVGEESVTQRLFSWRTWINSPVWTENMFNAPRVVSSKTLMRGKFLNSIVWAKFIDSSDSHLFSMILLCIALLNFWLRTVFVFSLNFLCFHNFYFFFNYCNNKNITKTRQEVIHSHLSTLSWWRYLSYRNQSIDLLCKTMDWFLYVSYLRHERVE